MNQPNATSAQVARLFFDRSEDGTLQCAYTIRHKNGNTIYEDRHGSIHVGGIYQSREAMERAMFHPRFPIMFQQFDRV